MSRINPIILAMLLLVAAFVPALPEPQISKTVTFTTGTAQRVANSPTRANSLFIQMQPGSTAIGYVLYAAPGTTCVASTASQVVATLAPGTATAPGGSFSFGAGITGGFDAGAWCVQGSSSDTAIISYDLRN